MLSAPRPPAEVSIPDNYRILHQFIAKSRWLEHLEKKKMENIIPLVTITHNDVQMPGLKRHIEAMLSRLQSTLPPGEHFVRRLISTRPT
jgi:hypothetical protein